MVSGFAHNLQPGARDYLEKNPHLLDGANMAAEGSPRN
jgi:hypothetical protein